MDFRTEDLWLPPILRGKRARITSRLGCLSGEITQKRLLTIREALTQAGPDRKVRFAGLRWEKTWGISSKGLAAPKDGEVKVLPTVLGASDALMTMAHEWAHCLDPFLFNGKWSFASGRDFWVMKKAWGQSDAECWAEAVACVHVFSDWADMKAHWKEEEEMGPLFWAYLDLLWRAKA